MKRVRKVSRGGSKNSSKQGAEIIRLNQQSSMQKDEDDQEEEYQPPTGFDQLVKEVKHVSK